MVRATTDVTQPRSAPWNQTGIPPAAAGTRTTSLPRPPSVGTPQAPASPASAGSCPSFPRAARRLTFALPPGLSARSAACQVPARLPAQSKLAAVGAGRRARRIRQGDSGGSSGPSRQASCTQPLKEGTRTRITISPLSVLLGALGAGALMLLTSAVQSGWTASPTVSDRFWPPRPDRIVTLDSANLPNADIEGRISIPSQSSITIYTVPAGQDLVLVDASTVNNLGAAELVQEGPSGSVIHLNAARFRSMPSSAPLGRVFASGSSVVIRNRSGTDADDLAFSFVGYLVGS